MARISRRDLLRAACAAGVGFMLPGIGNAAPGVASTYTWTRSLILVELDGGNDGLNTVIPYASAAYASARPTLKITSGTHSVGSDANGVALGLNPVMSWAKSLWNAQELAIVLGVGMPNPNRSHFRGIDIWNTGSDSGTVLGTGWLTRVFSSSGQALPGTAAAHGTMLSRATSSPLAGNGMRVLAMKDGPGFITASENLREPPTTSTNPALQHVLNVQHDVVAASGLISTALTPRPTFSSAVSWPTGHFGNQCKAVAELIAAGVVMPVYKLSIGGFDNHANQRDKTDGSGKHDDLLAQLARGLKGIRDALAEKGRFNDVLMMTYSEFGRRVAENSSKGTDHGTAAPHFIIGSTANLRGGLYSTQPSLTDLDHGDLKHSIDYRRMYATAGAFLGFPTATAIGAGHAPIDNLLK